MQCEGLTGYIFGYIPEGGIVFLLVLIQQKIIQTELVLTDIFYGLCNVPSGNRWQFCNSVAR